MEEKKKKKKRKKRSKMNSLEAIDEMVKEYLLFRGFIQTFRSLETDIKNDKDKGFQVHFFYFFFNFTFFLCFIIIVLFICLLDYY